jgi:isopentenyl-diphosphate delta-isomerase
MVGQYEADPIINKEEVMEFKWITLSDLKLDMEKHPEKYTAWFKIILNEYMQRLV